MNDSDNEPNCTIEGFVEFHELPTMLSPGIVAQVEGLQQRLQNERAGLATPAGPVVPTREIVQRAAEQTAIVLRTLLQNEDRERTSRSFRALSPLLIESPAQRERRQARNKRKAARRMAKR